MKKILFSIGLYFLASKSINAQITYSPKTANLPVEEEGYRKLKIDEINFVTSYYSQNGNHSAVTGGIGTEFLFDIANSLDLKLSYQKNENISHSLSLDASIDYYSSASSDNIDPRSVSGASREDVHFYPSLSYTRKNESKHNSIGGGLAYSTEWDYQSFGGNVNYSKSSKDNNTELSLKIGAFFDTWEVILPSELRIKGGGRDRNNVTKPRNSYSFAIGLSQVITKRLQLLFMVEPSYQEGLLSTPYHRVYFTDNTLKVEKLPGKRLKLPASIRANYFIGDNIIVRSFYRYYTDDWGMTAHTASLEIPVKITSFLSVTPHYRYNKQNAVKYFSPYQKHKTADTFYTSDYDISTFTSNFYGAGIRFAPPGGIMGNRWWNTVELRYGHYTRSEGMVSNVISFTTKFK
jgi:Protein of unknown function (DUF3570)